MQGGPDAPGPHAQTTNDLYVVPSRGARIAPAVGWSYWCSADLVSFLSTTSGAMLAPLRGMPPLHTEKC
jgi:hypothetical protein